jgi:homoprotocatechuate degradation regulator HpaR
MRSLEASLPLKLLKAREAVMNRFRPLLQAQDITEQQWRVLRALVEHDEMDAGELARLVALRMPSLSRILVDLAARGLLLKDRSTADRRHLQVAITTAGRELFAVMSPHSEVAYAEIEATLGDDEMRELMTRLDRLIEVLQPA